MKAIDLEIIMLAIIAGCKTDEELAERTEIPLDEIKEIKKRHKHPFDYFLTFPDKKQIAKEYEWQFSKKNPYTYYDKKGKPLPEDQQPPQYHLWKKLSEGEISMGDLVRYCIIFEPDKKKVINAMDDISMPWRENNNWQSLVLRRCDSDGNFLLNLQYSISYNLMGAVEVVFREISKYYKEIKDAIFPSQETSIDSETNTSKKNIPTIDISEECPYRNRGSKKSYATIWQTLKNHLPEGISETELKKEAKSILRKPAKNIKTDVGVVISAKDKEGTGRHACAKPGYWVKRGKYGRLILKKCE